MSPDSMQEILDTPETFSCMQDTFRMTSDHEERVEIKKKLGYLDLQISTADTAQRKKNWKRRQTEKTFDSLSGIMYVHGGLPELERRLSSLRLN